MTDLDTPTLLSEHDRLRQVIHEAGRSKRWASEAIHLAQEAIEHYDGRKLYRSADYHALFREVAVARYAQCRDVGSAIVVFDRLRLEAARERHFQAKLTAGFVPIDQALHQFGVAGTRVDL